MLAVWPDSVMESVPGRTGYKVLVRPSMEKFASDRSSLEVLLPPINMHQEMIGAGGNPRNIHGDEGQRAVVRSE